jgi:hypothetical protein
MNSKHIYEEEEEKVSLIGEDGKGEPKTQAPARGRPGATGGEMSFQLSVFSYQFSVRRRRGRKLKVEESG